MVSPSNITSADSRHPSHTALDEILQVLLCLQQVRTRQDQDSFIRFKATDDLDVIEICHTGSNFSNLPAGRIENNPEFAAESVVRCCAAALTARPTWSRPPLSSLGCIRRCLLA